MIIINQVICCVGVRIVLIISINELVIFLFLALKVLSYVLQWAWLVIHKLNKCVCIVVKPWMKHHNLRYWFHEQFEIERFSSSHFLKLFYIIRNKTLNCGQICIAPLNI